MLLYCVECLGDFAGDLCSILVRLLSKPTGGYRPIGLYRGVYRIWAKARQPLAHRWHVEKAPDGDIAMAPGRHVGDAVWRGLMRNVLHDDDGMHVFEGLLDVSKCYERVIFAALIAKAIAHDYPLAILRVSIASYKWPRYLIFLCGIISDPVFPVRGLVAGNSFATDELCSYTLDGVRAVREASPHSRAATHVDDICLSVVAPSTPQLVIGLRAAGAALLA